MQKAFEDLAKCEGHTGDLLTGCGAQTDGICNVCCGDDGCNFGTCRNITRTSVSICIGWLCCRVYPAHICDSLPTLDYNRIGFE